MSLDLRLLRAARAFLDPELQAGKIQPADAYRVLADGRGAVACIRDGRGRALHVPLTGTGQQLFLWVHAAARSAARKPRRRWEEVRSEEVSRLHPRAGLAAPRSHAQGGDRGLRAGTEIRRRLEPMTARVRRTSLGAIVLAVLAASGGGAVCAQMPAEGAAAVGDVATVEVDARAGAARHHVRAPELPVAAGPLTLGLSEVAARAGTAPAGPLTSLGGPRFTAAGRGCRGGATRSTSMRSTWRFRRSDPPRRGSRDRHVDRARRGGAGTRDAAHGDGVAAHSRMESAGAVSGQDARSDDLTYQASVRLPDGWKFATALDTASRVRPAAPSSRPVSLTTLRRFDAARRDAICATSRSAAPRR